MITIIGVLSVIAQGFMAWVFLRDPSAGLNGNPKMIWFNIIVFLSGLVVYYIAKFVQRAAAWTWSSASSRSRRSDRLMPLFGKKDKGKTHQAVLRHGRARLRRPRSASSSTPASSTSVDVLVLGGDIAGKMVVPILDLGGGKYRATIQSITHELDGGDEPSPSSRSVPASWGRTRPS